MVQPPQDKNKNVSSIPPDTLMIPTREKQIREEIEREEELMPKILVVDDNPQAILMYEKFLRGRKYQVLTATEGEQALLLLQATEVKLVILDYKLPDMTGLQVLRQIRERSLSLPVIIITADDSIEVVREVAKEGISSYLVKPVKLDMLEQRVKDALNAAFKNEPPALAEPT